MPTSAITLPDDPEALDLWIKKQENSTPDIKESARATIIWADPHKKNKTEYSLVYLHGFKATHCEGDPIHRQVAQELGCNLYLSRLEGHGLNIDKPLKNLHPAALKESAINALAIGEKIGENVIIMGTSTGASLGIFLASKPELNKKIKTLVLYSPLIEFYGISQWLLGNGLGRYILKAFPGKKYLLTSELGFSEAEREIWYHTYAMQGALALGEFIQKTMNSHTFSTIKCPVFIGYYYKNYKEQDKVVSVGAIKKMYRKIPIQESRKVLKNFPEAGTHVISSGLVSNSIERIKKDTIQFLKHILQLNSP